MDERSSFLINEMHEANKGIFDTIAIGASAYLSIYSLFRGGSSGWGVALGEVASRLIGIESSITQMQTNLIAINNLISQLPAAFQGTLREERLRNLFIEARAQNISLRGWVASEALMEIHSHQILNAVSDVQKFLNIYQIEYNSNKNTALSFLSSVAQIYSSAAISYNTHVDWLLYKDKDAVKKLGLASVDHTAWPFHSFLTGLINDFVKEYKDTRKTHSKLSQEVFPSSFLNGSLNAYQFDGKKFEILNPMPPQGFFTSEPYPALIGSYRGGIDYTGQSARYSLSTYEYQGDGGIDARLVPVAVDTADSAAQIAGKIAVSKFIMTKLQPVTDRFSGFEKIQDKLNNGQVFV